MKNEAEELLNDLLSRWHRFATHQSPPTGFYKVNPACKQFRASRQYDDVNGAFDTDAENQILEAVGWCIDCMEQPWRTAVEFNARNLATGRTVWRSPRLPENDIDRAFLVAEARGRLYVLLQRDGVA